ncbi:hypothetical protein BTA51_01120 [Hahella sp. CCB-MM4]|uniref:hypothetical protein n=1 Tax=Hahella sp. (strain CCB-MM4) TaxID=1926491 RepID=UPI000B9BC668|nr:hypothetical protein [Hahella sp. CCB-MM4]OZG75033.1 hypothetical protein BTA51_01120 [Hahella sp. CCB-MM4]
MALDLYAGNEKDRIATHEEALFLIVIEHDENYPVLNWLWSEFYNGPRINPEKSNLLVHELLQLYRVVENDKEVKWLAPITVRLASFFSIAYRNNIEVIAESD